MKKVFSYILYSIYGLIVLGLIVLFIAPPLPVIGALDVKIVKSGSMEPSIMTGAVVLMREVPVYGLQDVITFTSESSNIPTTHRIIGTENVNGVEYFITKGDANEERDTNLVSPADILGKVTLDVPYVGFVLDFARQPLGFALLVGIPALLIIIDEIGKIWSEVRRSRRSKKKVSKFAPSVVDPYGRDESEKDTTTLRNTTASPLVSVRSMDIKPTGRVAVKKVNTFSYTEPKKTLTRMAHDIRPRMATATFGMLVMFVLAGQTWVSGSIAYVADTETTSANSLTTQTIDFTASALNSQFSILGSEIDGVSDTDITVVPDVAMVEDLLYKVSAVSTDGNATLCDDISVDAGEPLSFSGVLTDIVGDDIDFSSLWHLDFSLSGNNTYALGDNCDIDIVLKGYLEDEGDVGYTDTEIVSLAFVSSGPVIQVQSLRTLSASGATLTVETVEKDNETDEEKQENSEDNEEESGVVEEVATEEVVDEDEEKKAEGEEVEEEDKKKKETVEEDEVDEEANEQTEEKEVVEEVVVEEKEEKEEVEQVVTEDEVEEETEEVAVEQGEQEETVE